MEVEGSQVGRDFWLQWVSASTVGMLVGFFLGMGVDLLARAVVLLAPIYNVLGDRFGLCFQGIGLGIGVGVLQWLVLRRRVSGAGWWVLATTVGYAVAWAVGWAVGEAVRPHEIVEYWDAAVGEHAFWVMWGPFFNPVVVAVGGAVSGAMQWLVLRSQVSRAGWWVLASTVGWLVGPLVGFLVSIIGGAVGDEYTMFFLSIIASWAVAGGITGIALVWLLRQSVAEA